MFLIALENSDWLIDWLIDWYDTTQALHNSKRVKALGLVQTQKSRTYREHGRHFLGPKNNSYEQRIRDVEHASFMPLVFSATGGLRNEAKTYYKRLALLLTSKWENSYSSTVACPRCRLSFSLLRSSIRCIQEPTHTQAFLSEPHQWIWWGWKSASCPSVEQFSPTPMNSLKFIYSSPVFFFNPIKSLPACIVAITYKAFPREKSIPVNLWCSIGIRPSPNFSSWLQDEIWEWLGDEANARNGHCTYVMFVHAVWAIKLRFAGFVPMMIYAILLHIFTALPFICGIKIPHNQLLILHVEMFICGKYMLLSVHITVNTFLWNWTAYQFYQYLLFHPFQKYDNYVLFAGLPLNV